MSNHGVDLLRSDTGQYLDWPGTLRPVAALPAQADRSRLSAPAPSVPSADLPDLSPVAPSRAWAFATRNTMDRKTLALTLVNWMILLVLMCGFLLAKTLTTDEALSGTTADSGVVATATR